LSESLKKVNAKTYLKISGKKFELPDQPQTGWKFSTRPGGWVIAELPTGERRRFMICESRANFSTSLGGYLFFGQWIKPQRELSGQKSADDLTAQFPGKVRKLLVQAGAMVQEGDSLLLVEAMKMEFAVKAPYSGLIKEVLVQEGQQVSPGVAFVDLEAKTDEK
jgi:3-methylcrotonyl-CoA carboxylase alpha subunit